MTNNEPRDIPTGLPDFMIIAGERVKAESGDVIETCDPAYLSQIGRQVYVA